MAGSLTTRVGRRSVTLAIVAFMYGASVAAQAVAVAPSAEKSPLTTRRVTVDVDRAPLRAVLDAIAAQAGLVSSYNMDVIPSNTRVTLHVRDVTAADAFESALRGTGLIAQVHATGNVFIVRSGAAQDGGISGTVTDPSGAPVANARVMIIGTSIAAETDKQGRFHLASLAAGTYVVRIVRLGFQANQTSVVVSEQGTATMSVKLNTVSTRLTEVVTTATGEEARLKVANDVGTINADSLMQNTLTRSVSDLLTAHTPGVQATPTGGAVGAPTRIRIRGVTSAQLNNDPIVVIDGIRVNAQTTLNSVKFFGFGLPSSQVNTGSTLMSGSSLAAPSPLDQIDPNSIESIDVLKGPTATALYGPDASTGVIVIKTKTGKPGPWRYHVSGDYGWIVPPRTYPLQWTGWGTSPTGGDSYAGCPLITFYDAYSPSQSNGGCSLDSVTAFNSENNPDMTTLGTGYNRGVVMDASGGGATVQGFLQGDYSDAVGQQRLPRIEQRRLARLWTTPVPSWMIRPNGQVNTHVTSKIDAQFTPNFDVAATGQGTYQTTRNDGTGLTGFTRPYGPTDTVSFTPAENLRRRNMSSTKRGIGTGNARYQPASWLVLTGSGGLDYSLRDDQSLQRPQDCTLELNPSGCAGSSMHSAMRTEVLVPSFTAGATFTYDMTGWLQGHTSFGEQYSRTQTYIMGVSATNLAFGQNLITGGTIDTPTEATDEGASAGWYAEQQLAFKQRLFLTAALRRDASSSFGGSIATPTFPKYGASWLVSNEPFFPHQGVVTQLRLRAAYGESGKQGSQADVLRSFLYTSGITPDGAAAPVIVLSGLGNPQLQPQRDREWEGGFDLSLYDDRATMTATWYRKQSSNAIMSINVPPSPGPMTPVQAENVGAIRNTGYELQLNLRPVDTKIVTWDFNFQASKNNNLLVNKGNLQDLPDNSGGTIRPGYPLFGFWQQPIVAYGDYNHNGILETSEVAFADSQVFVGSTDPNGTFAYSNSLTFLQGRLRFNSLVNQVKGLTTRLDGLGLLTRGMVDPAASIAEQAAAIQATKGNAGYLGTVSYVQLAELSASVTLPARLAQRLHSQSATVTVAGRNLALWSNYRGADPTTNDAFSSGGLSDASVDNGNGLAQPRNWIVRLNFQF